MTQSATRPVTIGELQRAWHAVQVGQFRSHPGGLGSGQVGADAATARWVSRERVLPVLGCHPQAGASTLAIAIATVAAPARVLECASASATGLSMAATAELGTSPAGWRLGRRGHVELARAGEILDAPIKVPLPEPPAGQVGLSVLDVGWELGQVMATPPVRATVTEAPHDRVRDRHSLPAFGAWRTHSTSSLRQTPWSPSSVRPSGAGRDTSSARWEAKPRSLSEPAISTPSRSIALWPNGD